MDYLTIEERAKLERNAEESYFNEQKRKKTTEELCYDKEEYLVSNGNNVKKLQVPQKEWTNEKWEEYHLLLTWKCKLDKLKSLLKLRNKICGNCNKKNKYCTCTCKDCKKVGNLNCRCLPF